jgi:catabolite repression protein CreC
VSHADGTIIVYDKERDDGVFLAQEPTPISGPDLNGTLNAAVPRHAPPGQRSDWNPMERIFVTMPPWHPGIPSGALTSPGAKGEKERIAKNPVSHWKVSTRSVLGQFLLNYPTINPIRRLHFPQISSFPLM